jgi:hypothetical protein
MGHLPWLWEFVQFRLGRVTYAAQVVGLEHGKVQLRVFFEEGQEEKALRDDVPFSPSPREGHWSPVPEAPKGYYADLQPTVTGNDLLAACLSLELNGA